MIATRPKTEGARIVTADGQRARSPCAAFETCRGSLRAPLERSLGISCPLAPAEPEAPDPGGDAGARRQLAVIRSIAHELEHRAETSGAASLRVHLAHELCRFGCPLLSAADAEETPAIPDP